MRKLELILLVSLTLSGCASHPAVAIFEGYNEVFYGKAAPQLNLETQLFVDEGVFSIQGEVTGTQCKGRTSVTHIDSLVRHCRGQTGNVRAECDDGKLLSAEWSSESCAVGFGHGQDNFGNAFAFTFGMPEHKAIQKIEQYLGISGNTANLLNTNRTK